MIQQDTYMRFIMTVIAVCLAVIAFKDIDLVPNAYAELNSGDNITVKSPLGGLDVNMSSNSKYDPFYVKIVE